ncbi:MAG: efflux RND transporter periplasmic adaptor subunit [Candidatus Aminicenantes bacterium]|nr:MAG: efflux RND transporter periplasmic adaptor subunit [Candidatus Aminicenantes bacterium]
MKKIMTAKILVVLFLFFTLFSCKPPGQQEEPQEEAFGAAPVKVFKVKKQRISEKLLYTGTIEAWKKTNITPDIGGKIARIHVEEGDRVRKGQLLAEMDTRAIRLQLKQAEAASAVAEANYNDAKRNNERMDRLLKEKAVSDQQHEKIKLAFEAAEAQLQQTRAALNLAQHNLDVSLMKAPFSGVIASKNAEVGDVINPMMGGFSTVSGVLTLMDFSRIKIEIDASHQDIVLIKKGQPALLKVAAFPDEIFKGSVSLVNLTADPSTKKFKVEVSVNNPDFVLRPNTFGEVTLEVSTHENALVIPQKAVLEHTYVFVVRKDNIAERKEITLGLQNSDRIEIVQGLKEGDLVVVEGNYGLEDGAKLDIKEVIE